MPALAPIKLTLYDLVTYDPRGEYICNFVPMRYLKLAIQLAKSKVNVNEDALVGLIIDLFGHQFSVNELLNYSEHSDRMLVLQAIVLRPGLIGYRNDEEKQANEAADGQVYQLDNEDWITELEISLVKAFDWSLRDFDDTYLETLLPFVAHFAGSSEKEPAREKVFADQLSWT